MTAICGIGDSSVLAVAPTLQTDARFAEPFAVSEIGMVNIAREAPAEV
jgi:hypothetical protein